MPSLNQGRFIQSAINSVISQSVQPLELIVSDGGSQDKTVQILKDNAQKHAAINWTSETDAGPASAINKAFKKTRGTIIGWLNSDDMYCDGAFRRVEDYFQRNSHKVLVYGNAYFIDEGDTVTGQYPVRKPEVGINEFHAGCFICQPAVFFKRSLIDLLGYLDETLGASFDFEYWLRAFSHFPERIGHMDHYLANSRIHDQTISITQKLRVMREGMYVTHKHLGSSRMHWFVNGLKILHEKSGNDAGELKSYTDFARPLLNNKDFSAALRQFETNL